MFASLKSAFDRAGERAVRRRAFRVLAGQSEYLLNEIGLTRRDVRRAALCDRNLA